MITSSGHDLPSSFLETRSPPMNQVPENVRRFVQTHLESLQDRQRFDRVFALDDARRERPLLWETWTHAIPRLCFAPRLSMYPLARHITVTTSISGSLDLAISHRPTSAESSSASAVAQKESASAYKITRI